jgi:hypothetical protein
LGWFGVAEGMLFRVKLRGGFFESIRMIADLAQSRLSTPLRFGRDGLEGGLVEGVIEVCLKAN